MAKARIFAIVALVAVVLAGCGKPARVFIRLREADPAVVEQQKPRTVAPLRVAVSSILSPKETMTSYTGLISYLQAKLDRPVVLLQRKSYKEVNDLIEKGGADVAFVCSGGYVAGNRIFGMEVLAVPQVNGQHRYQSYVITPASSGITSLASLKGRSFAFTDPLSFSGRIAPLYMVASQGYDVDTFFGRTFFTYSHDNSIKAVVDGIVDGAAVDSLVFDYAVSKDPGIKERVRVIDKSFMVGNPPVVVNPAIDPVWKEHIKNILLAMHQDPEGKKALEPLHIERFAPADDQAYAPLNQAWDILRDKL